MVAETRKSGTARGYYRQPAGAELWQLHKVRRNRASARMGPTTTHVEECGEASESCRSHLASQLRVPEAFSGTGGRFPKCQSHKVALFLRLKVTLVGLILCLFQDGAFAVFHFLKFTTSHKRGSSKIGIFEKPFWIVRAYPSHASQSRSLNFSCAGKSNPRTEEIHDRLHIPMHTRRTVPTTLALEEAMPPVTITRI